MQAKFIYLTKRNPQTAREDFPDSWIAHSRLPKPGLTNRMEYTSLSYCFVEETPFEAADGTGPYDGVALLDLKGLQSIVQAATRDSIPHVVEDEKRAFSTVIRDCSMLFWTESVLEGAMTNWATIRFLRRRQECMPTPFRESWLKATDSLMLSPPDGLRRLVRNTLIVPGPTGFNYDGVEELWFDNLEDARAGARLLNDTSNLMEDSFDFRLSRALITRRILFKDTAGIKQTSALALSQ